MSIVEYPFPQRSPEWFSIRIGKLSGSLFPAIMPSSKQKTSDWNKTQLSILQELASQILTGERQASFHSGPMEWGMITEDAAAAFYSQITGYHVRECGFFENSDFPGCGVSPDRIINENKILEIKCPLSKNHVKYLCNPCELWEDYKWQVIGEIMISGMDGGELISFDPRFIDDDKKMVRYHIGDISEEKIILASRIEEAVSKIKEIIA